MIWDAIATETETTATCDAPADAFFSLGLRYCIGHGVARNNVVAHKWFNIAAIKGSDKARNYRCELSREMTASEVAEAQRQAREFLTLH